MIIDGEAVVLDEKGRPDFGLLQQSLGASGKTAGNRASDAILYAFDLIYLDGPDLRGVEYRSRRHLLEDTLDGKDGAIRLSETLDAEPNVLLDNVCRLGLEGVVGKHFDQPYRSGRTGGWVKVKCVQSEAFMVVGYELSTTSPPFAILRPLDGHAPWSTTKISVPIAVRPCDKRVFERRWNRWRCCARAVTVPGIRRRSRSHRISAALRSMAMLPLRLTPAITRLERCTSRHSWAVRENFSPLLYYSRNLILCS
jgi:hypothetical protein